MGGRKHGAAKDGRRTGPGSRGRVTNQPLPGGGRVADLSLRDEGRVKNRSLPDEGRVS